MATCTIHCAKSSVMGPRWSRDSSNLRDIGHLRDDIRHACDSKNDARGQRRPEARQLTEQLGEALAAHHPQPHRQVLREA